MTTRAPAEGERAAVKAFEAQYRIAATRILGVLEQGTFLAVRMVDPRAGRVDDLVLELTTGVIGVQVKWGEYSAVESLADLLASTANKPPLLAQLAEGWQLLRKQHPQRPVRVELVIHGVLNANNQAAVIHSPTEAPHRHTEAFFRHVWNTAVAPASWRPTLEAVRVSTALGEPEFELFRRNCSIGTLRANEIGLGAPGDVPASLLDDDIVAIADVLRRAVAESASGSVVRFDREALFKALNWNDRFQVQFRHEFPTKSAYQPNVETLERMRALLTRYTAGYIALLGKPGSGKSTLLTNLMREAGWGRVVRYYVFVPDGSNEGRADALPFLGDLITGLNTQGLPSRRPENTGEAKRVLEDRLREAGNAFQQRGERTLILIDGLDHAERDSGAVDNLLAALPNPETVPIGVSIVLGSQTLALDRLAPSVRESFDREPDRQIVMGSLSRAAVMLLANQVVPDTLNGDAHAALYSRTEGHALSVQLALSAIESRAADESIDGLLARIDLVNGDVLRVYRHAYLRIAGTPTLRTLLGCIARLRDPVDLVHLLQWFGDDCVRSFRTHFSFLFRPLSPTRWAFGHNSFRVFLQGKTALNGLDVFDPALERDWHRQIAEFASRSTDVFAHEELHHRACAGDDDSVLALARVEWFRAQFFLRRAPQRMSADLIDVLRVAGLRRSRPVIAHALLIEGELNVRGWALDAIDLVRLHYLAGGADVLSAIMDAGGLDDYAPNNAMQLANLVADRGDRALAQRVFDAHEPLDLLHGVSRVVSRADVELLQAWARTAWRFRSPVELLCLTAAIQHRVDDEPQSGVSAAECLSLQVTVALGFLRVGRQDAFVAFRDGIDSDDQIAFDDELSYRQFKQGSQDGEALLQAIRRFADGGHGTLTLAEYADRALRLAGDRALAQTLHARAVRPSPPDGYVSDAQLRSHGRECLAYWRIAAALDPNWTATLAIPAEWHSTLRDAEAASVTAYYRLLARLAAAWGAALRGEHWDAGRLASWLQPIWRQLIATQPRYSSTHYAVRNNAIELIDALVVCAAAHGVADAVVRAMLANTASEPKWLLEWTLRLVESNALNASVAERLNRCKALLDDIVPLDSLSDHLQDLARLCETFARLGDTSSAQSALQRCFSQSFGITLDKDYHAVDCAGLMLHIARMDPTSASSRVLEFAAALERADDSNAGRGYREAWTLTLHAATLASMELGVALWERLVANGQVPLAHLLDGLIRGINERREAHPRLLLAIAVDVLAPLQTSGELAVAQLIADAALQLDDSQYQRTLRSKLCAHSDAEVVAEYLPSLDPAMKPGPPMRDSTEASIVAGRRMLTETTLLETAMDVAKFIELATIAEPGEGPTPWNRAFAIAAPRATATELAQLVSMLPKLNYPANACADLAKALVTHNQSDTAISMLERALSHHAAGSWTRWADLAPRRVLMEALVEVHPSARDRALDDFVVSRTTRSRYAFQMSAPAVLDDVQFALHLPPDDLWRELSAYLSQLWPFRLDSLPFEVELGATPLTSDEALVTAVLTLSLQPLRRVHSRVDSALVAAAEDPPLRSTILRTIARLQCSDDSKLIRCLSTLELVRRGDRPPDDVIAQLNALRLHPNFSVRELVCKALDEKLVARQAIPLSPIYELTLQSQPSGGAPALYDVFEPMSDLEDDAAILDRVFAPQIDEISRTTELPRANVIHRASQFMAESGGIARYGSEVERSISRRRSSWGLRVPHVRPRVEALRNAVARVVAELIDADQLDAQLPPALARMLVRSNTRFAVMPAAQSPNGLPGYIEQIGRRRSTPESPVQINCSALHLPDGRVIVAAEWSTRLVKGSLRHDLSFVARDAANALLELKPSRWVDRSTVRFDQYPDADDEMPTLGILLTSGELDAERESCVAFSPAVAHALKWQLTSDRLFCWQDPTGTLAAETIIWASNDSPAALPGTGAAGSAVVLTAAAWREVRSMVGEGGILVAHANTGDAVADSMDLIGHWDAESEISGLEPSR